MNSKMNTFLKNLVIIFTIMSTSISGFLGIAKDVNIPPDNNYPIGQALQVADNNLYWPEDQIFPSFTEPKGDLIGFPSNILSHKEMTALACLQGFVNAIDTRMVILDGDVSKWLGDYGFGYKTVAREEVYSYIKDLCDGAVAGVVLYSDELHKEYVNLASSIGNTMNALPLTAEDYDKWRSEGIDLPVLVDIRGLSYTNPTEIYKYFFDNYWQNCNKRILVVQRTDLSFQMRDLASAVGGAVVYLSCAGGTETWMFKKYLNSMVPGESILTGWYADQERELMTVAAQCGLSCVPSDFFNNPTVFAQKQEIQVPAVPDMPEPEDKIYIAYFLSDGDNIQYDMHAMREFWDNNSYARGKVPINWTISPALVDIAPGMMNYYYTRATDKECFVCGPSGMGYTMPKNTFGGNKGNNFLSNSKFKAYVEMTDAYLQKSGLRTVTIWDNLSAAQRRIYSQNSPYLYGVTVQHFTNSSLKARFTGVTKDMLFIQQTPGYFAQNAEGNLPLSELGNHIKDAVNFLKYDGNEPVFVATQVSVWAFHNINEVVKLEQELSDYYAETYGKDVVEFVRADHFFNLYYEANALPQDVTLKADTTATATSNSEKAYLTLDGTNYGESIWTADTQGQQSITYSLGKTYNVEEITLYHAETNGLDKALNTDTFTIEVSNDGKTWKKVAEIKGNTDSSSNVTFKAQKCSFIRINIIDAGADSIARIAYIDILGTMVK